MSRVIVDDTLRTKLQNLTEPLELCDDSGRVLGRFLPTFDPSLYEGLESTISRDELHRRLQDKGKSYSTKEVLEHLDTL